MEMLKLCHRVALLKRIIEIFYQLYAIANS